MLIFKAKRSHRVNDRSQHSHSHMKI